MEVSGACIGMEARGANMDGGKRCMHGMEARGACMGWRQEVNV